VSADIGIVTKILNALIFVLSGGFGRTLPEALWLMQHLVILEVVLLGAWWALGQQEALAQLISKTLWFGALLWFLTAWPSLSLAFVQSLVQVGIQIGGSSITLHEFLDPSAIMQHGLSVIGTIFTRLTSFSGFSAVMNIPELFILGLAAMGIWLAFFILAAQVFIKTIEFYLASTIVVILLPFGAFRHTAFLAEKAFAVVIGSGIGLAVLAVITSLILPFLVTLQVSADPTLYETFTVLTAAGLLGLLAWQAPGMAAGLLAGAPSLSAATLAHGAMAATATTLLGAAAVDRLSRGIMGAAQQATAGGAAIGTALRHGGVRGLGQLTTQAGRDLTQATIGNFRAASQRGQQYAHHAMSSGEGPGTGAGARVGSRPPRDRPAWALGLAQRVIPPPASPQGGVHVPLNPS
jgi:type IV secretion system protein TrbL